MKIRDLMDTIRVLDAARNMLWLGGTHGHRALADECQRVGAMLNNVIDKECNVIIIDCDVEERLLTDDDMRKTEGA